MAEIRWSVAAELDLHDIEAYIARDSPVYAIRLVDNIVEAVERLELLPRSGRIVPEFNRSDLREVIYGSYRIVYLASAQTVTILRVVHGSRDMVEVAVGQPWDSIE